MKRMSFQTGEGNGQATVTGGQLLDISMIPGEEGSWIQIHTWKPIWVPAGSAFELGAHELGLCCGADKCDQFPGDVQIVIVFGQEVSPLDERQPIGSEPLSWFVVHTGC